MGEEELDGGSGMLAARLIDRATSSTEPDIDPRLLKAIKSAVRSSDVETRSAVHLLMTLMKRPHSQVRYLALLIIDELFMRSKLFRTLFVETLDQFLTLSVGFRQNNPLPPPSKIASNLRKKSIEFLEKWNSNFGIHYRQLRLGFDYLKSTLKLKFPNNFENAARIQRERREREIKTQEILLKKFENLKENFDSIKGEINSTIDEIKECLEVISEKQNEFNFNPQINFINEENYEMEGNISSLEMRQIRINSIKEANMVHETLENKPLFDTLRELHKLLVTKHLISIQDLISVLIRVELSDNRFRDIALKDLIDLRNNIQSIKPKLTQIGCDFDNKRKINENEEEDEDFWEEGKIEKFPSNFIQNKPKNENTPSTSNNNNNNNNNNNLDPERYKLLKEAPKINWGPLLDNWGSKSENLANQRGLEIEAHWGRVDSERIIPRDKIEEINMNRTIYEEDPIEIKPCSARLKNGSLCQRRDLRICPFHGLIVPRDEKGNLVNSCEGVEREGHLVNSCQDEEGESDLVNNFDNEGVERESGNNEGVEREKVEKLVREAVKNVRRREREERETKREKVKRERGERETKREKVKRVREHNQEVLRESALASTSYSENLVSNQREFKLKKQTLASMLKKKVTAKDRIAKKLL